MSLKHRQQNPGLGTLTQGQQGQRGGMVDSTSAPSSPVRLIGGREYFSVVDGEILNVIGTTDIPGMSPAYWLQSDEDGSTAPVSVKEAPIFTTAQRALQYLNEQRGTRRPLQ
jgi:hypothetical protein